jgi:PadR family transcriptional regulator PadR
MPKGQFIGEFELYVLLAAQALGEDGAYGATIRRHIEERTGREVAVGAIYATLARLADKRLVDFHMSTPEPVPGGRTRKHVRLTPAGLRALTHSTGSLVKLIDAVSAAGRGRSR